jgi:hypothetical protein
MNSTRQRSSVLEKRGEEWIFLKLQKYNGILVKLWFLKLQLVLLPNSLEVLILEYFYKTIAWSQNYKKNILYLNRARMLSCSQIYSLCVPPLANAELQKRCEQSLLVGYFQYMYKVIFCYDLIYLNRNLKYTTYNFIY